MPIIKMRIVLTIAFQFLALLAISQADSITLKARVKELDQAMVSKDTAALNALLDKKLSYGHSNGWAQTKKEVLEDFTSGKLSYQKFESSGLTVPSLDKDWATVRMKLNTEGVVGGKAFVMEIYVMQVWKKDKKGWQLFARQGAKLN